MKTVQHDTNIYVSSKEYDARAQFVDLVRTSPLPDDEILDNMGLFLTSKTFARLLFFYEIYKKIVYTHGIIVEFGVRWGQNLSILSALRGIFEPFNRHRKIVGFDTFEGLKGMSAKDGERSRCKDGSYSVTPDYEEYLSRLLLLQEQLNPISHVKKYELVKGDVIETVPEYLRSHPETIISLAIFDLDIYAPSKAAFEAIEPYVCKGSILVFDELCDEIFPGETILLRELVGLKNVRIQRFPMTSRLSYMEIQ